MKTQRLQGCTRSGPCCAWWECRGQLYDKISKTLAREGYKSIVPQEWGKKRMGWKTEHNIWTFIPKRFILTRLAWDRLAWKKRSSLAGISGDSEKKVKLEIFPGNRQCTSTCPGPLSSPPAACPSFTRGRLAGCTTPSTSGGLFKELSKSRY